MATSSTEPTARYLPSDVTLLHDAVGAILTDEGFQVPSKRASDAVAAATQMLEWLKNDSNTAVSSSFSSSLAKSLRDCLPPGGMKRDVMWCNYHTLRTSVKFFLLWDQFLKASIKTGFDPIFFQFVTDYIFKKIIKNRYPVVVASTSYSVTRQTLSYEENNALRYAAGYIPRNILSKIKRSSKLSNVLELYMMELIEEDGAIYDESQDWVTLLNRGGLNQVNTKTFMFMTAMELIVRNVLKTSFPKNVKQELIREVSSDENVKSHWNIISAEWGAEESKVLFSMIVDLWVTMRGFSYASAWMEHHKLETKKSVQKSKGLRKNLNSS